MHKRQNSRFARSSSGFERAENRGWCTNDCRAGDDGHSIFGVAQLVEQIVFTPEKIEKMGLDPDTTPVGVWSGYYAPETELGDRLLESITSGQYKALSIVGRGRREPVNA